MKKDEMCFSRVVVKFGGTSLADGLKISKAAEMVAKESRRGTEIAVVVSAMGRTTDHLIATAEEACGGRVSSRDLDDIMAMGELTSARIFAAALRARGLKSRMIDPYDPEWPIITDGSFTKAKPILPLCEAAIRDHIQPLLRRGVIPVVPGFIGKTREGAITTLGRGGSDVTAFVLARG
ncbi:aspartate kinase, partial [Candidatus Bathyarchaeota archaeon]